MCKSPCIEQSLCTLRRFLINNIVKKNVFVLCSVASIMLYFACTKTNTVIQIKKKLRYRGANESLAP